MLPAKTLDLLGSSIHQALRHKEDEFFLINGIDVNELQALAMRMTYRFDDPNELRDWQNRLNGMLDGLRKHPWQG